MLVFEYLVIVLPRPGQVLALPAAGGLSYQASTLPALLEQLAPQIAGGVWLLVEDGQVADVQRLAPEARVQPVACVLCAGACAHPLPSAHQRVQWRREGTVEVAEVHLPRERNTPVLSRSSGPRMSRTAWYWTCCGPLARACR